MGIDQSGLGQGIAQGINVKRFQAAVLGILIDYYLGDSGIGTGLAYGQEADNMRNTLYAQPRQQPGVNIKAAYRAVFLF